MRVCILVVDDESDVELLFRQKFRREIRKGTVEMHFAFSGPEALERLRGGRPPDVVLVLSDINMPGMTGLELLLEIKEEYPGLKVFMITAYDDETKRELAAKYGADDYITKPIDFDALKRKVLATAV